ncbi:hypothetical protein Y032_0172g353 [Ancylostoma ceylanicum]|uniref:WASH complex subunit 4 N-terminal domain-containing protein n=1 Tax=Ancylostoma ceylanicum TaxID=53326 RepID=A0A016SV18_9BILA|nr:hypothetical protein Y032_0172g353 [Ancylostoma ceylanicum]
MWSRFFLPNPQLNVACRCAYLFLMSLDAGAARSVDSLTSCDNPIVDNCCSTLATILDEVAEIRIDAAEKYFPSLLLYESCDSEVQDQCQPLRNMTEFFPFLLDLSSFLSRVSLLFRNLLFQIRSFHGLEKTAVPGASERKLFRAWSGLGELLALLLQTDKIIESRPAVRNDWNSYCRAIGTAQHNPAQFGVSSDALRSLIATIATVEGQVMAGNGLRNCYEQSYNEIDDDKQFAARMRAVIVEMYNQWEKAAEGDIPDKHRLMVIIALFIFFHLHFPTEDTSLLKLIWKSHKKIVAFHLAGDILWIPCEFLMRELPSIVNAVDKKSVHFIQNLRETFYVEHCDAMLEEAVLHISAAEEWQFKMRTEMRRSETRDAASSLVVAEMMLKGARIAGVMGDLLRNVLNSHVGPLRMSKAKAYKVFGVVENIKAISQTFSECRRMLLECCQMACQQWRCHSLHLIDKARLSARESGDACRAAAFHIAIQCLLGSGEFFFEATEVFPCFQVIVTVRVATAPVCMWCRPGSCTVQASNAPDRLFPA